MVKSIVVTVLLLGNSQTAGMMGDALQQHYELRGVDVTREASSGKGVRYFLSAIKRDRKAEVIVGYRQKQRIRNKISIGVDYIIFGSLGGNDAYRGCCSKKGRKRLLNLYKQLFKELCKSGAIVIFNGSPPAQGKKLRRFDARRAKLDEIQSEAAVGTCVIRNSLRSMNIPADRDGYHYNKSANLYVEHLMTLPGMMLPILESSN